MNSRIFFAIASFTFFMPSISLAHPFHVSSTEIEWNPRSNSFEVSVQLDPNDLERELQRFSKKKLILEKVATQKVAADHAVFQYLTKVFEASYNGRQLAMKPVGFEVESKSAWIYFELATARNEIPLKLDSLTVTNKLLIHQHAQTNHFIVKIGHQRVSTTFVERNTTKIIRYNSEGQLIIAENH